MSSARCQVKGKFITLNKAESKALSNAGYHVASHKYCHKHDYLGIKFIGTR